MSYQRPQKPTLTGQRFKTRKRGLYPPISLPSYTCTQTKSPYSWTWCAWSFFFLFPSPPDEKERFDPTQFQESIVHGLNQTGTDLDAVAKFLDASGAKLDYRRYAETLFDILVAGGMLGEARCLSANWFAWVLIQQQHQQIEVRVSDAGLFFFFSVQPRVGLYLTTWLALTTASSRHKKTWRQCKHTLRYTARGHLKVWLF